MTKELRVQDIFIYPIKSLGGIRLTEAEVCERGFLHDRRWMLVTPDGMFVSQRKHPKLALLQVELKGKALFVSEKWASDNSILIPFDQVTADEISVTVWDDQMMARRVGEEYDQWFSEYLGFEVFLVKMTDQTRRQVSSKYAVNQESVSFADGMPYLIIGQASLDELNSRLESPVKMDRFRPNIVFSGGGAFEEDRLKRIQIGEVSFQIVKPCARCVMITVDQGSGEAGKEPLRTLATYRSFNNKVLFGQNMVALKEGLIKEGDDLIKLMEQHK